MISNIASLSLLIYPLPYTTVLGGSFSLGAGLDVAYANRLSLVYRGYRAHHHCPEPHLVAVTLPGSSQHPQS